ncbi:MAG: ferritin family protein [Desulfobacterales bacterium]|nr:ferritin family protein [Desulfobacterales bacterium]
MTYLRGDEDAREIIGLAYGMEEGLRGFYMAVGERTEDKEVADLARKLSGIEDRHKKRLFDLYLTLDSGLDGREAFESRIVNNVMEGGSTTEEFLERNREFMKTSPDLLNIAMMLETQALDLYMRYSEKLRDEKGKDVLFGLAEEEKGHLESLGRLMDKRV